MVCFVWKNMEHSHPLLTKGSNKSLQRNSLSSLMSSALALRQRGYDHSVQFTHAVMSDFLQHHGLQHARLPCPSPSPRVRSNSCPPSQWCCPTISSSVVLFFSCLQSCPASGSFPMSQLFSSGGQSIGASASVLLKNIQDWFPLGWTGLQYSP